MAAVCAVVSVSYRLYDTDLWTLLAQGRAIAVLGRVPRENLWTWAGYGAPDPSAGAWTFRLLAWTLWSHGGVTALFVWRWLSTLAAFGILWAVARRLGQRGVLPLVTTTLCVLAYRIRSDVRPETLSAILFALTLWLLEADRQATAAPADARRPPRTAWLFVPVVLLWANTHIGWYAAYLLLLAHLADALAAARHRAKRGAALARARRLALAGLAGLAAALVNPGGWRTVAEPFQFAFLWRGEPLYRMIGELHPLVWRANLRNGLPLLVAGWPLLLVWRARRRGVDVAETILCAGLTAAALSSQRFLGTYALGAAPYLARDLGDAIARRPAPAWLAGPWRRGLAAGLACVALSAAEWTRPELPLGIGLDLSGVPVRACDFVRDHAVRGRIFNPFHFGGYVAWRFWPDRSRLPFMITMPEVTPRDDRALYARAFSDPSAWAQLDARHRFEVLVLDREQDPGDHLPDRLDADTAWAMVFADDAAEVLVRRDGPRAALADSLGYRVLPAGREAREALLRACALDPALRARATAELERQAAGSPWNGRAEQLLGLLAAVGGRPDEARAHLERALAARPLLPGAHELLGLIALDQGRPRDALRHFERERALHGATAAIEREIGRSRQRLGERR